MRRRSKLQTSTLYLEVLVCVAAILAFGADLGLMGLSGISANTPLLADFRALRLEPQGRPDRIVAAAARTTGRQPGRPSDGKDPFRNVWVRHARGHTILIGLVKAPWPLDGVADSAICLFSDPDDPAASLPCLGRWLGVDLYHRGFGYDFFTVKQGRPWLVTLSGISEAGDFRRTAGAR